MRPSFSVFLLGFSYIAAAQTPDAKRLFEVRCAGCHGTDGAGGEHGPGIVGERREESNTRNQDVREIIRNGIPDGGMPGFRTLSEAEVNALAGRVRELRAPARDNPAKGDSTAGAAFFEGQGGCTKCHMVNGRGGLIGPDLSKIGQERTLVVLEESLHTPGAKIRRGYNSVSVRLTSGQTVRGIAKNESVFDLQLQDTAGKLHLYTRSNIEKVIRESGSLMPPLKASAQDTGNLLAYLSRLPVSGTPPVAAAGESGKVNDLPFSRIASPKPGDWPTYNGLLSGNRMSNLKQINASNVSQLAAKWLFPISSSRRLEVTPVVVDGVMYVTNANEAFGLDAANGREIWHYSRPLTKGVIGDAGGGINRGVAVLGDKLFMVTDHAHLIALNRNSGQLIWETEMADFREHYGTTSAPLVVKDLVLTGSSGGDEGARGFIDAYKASTGERVWRFWTMPAPGDPEAKTWQGRAIEHGCVAPWLTGTFDTELNTLYWPTGNPCPDYNGDERKGDNLYSSSVVALDPETGKLHWYFQFTPHDLHDWDATEPPVVINAQFRGKPRKLLLQANRNGFFYVLDRVTGEFLLGEPFVKKITWASGLDAKGRPVLLPDQEPTVSGTKTCPSVAGATNWMSTAYNPGTGLYYIVAQESCAIYTKSSAWWKPGESFYGGGARRAPGEQSEKFVKAIDIQTGKVKWELQQAGEGSNWGGLLSTAGGLVFYCDESGAFAALDAADGKPLWNFHTNQSWRASPMTYTADGKQFLAVAAGSNIIAFSLP